MVFRLLAALLVVTTPLMSQAGASNPNTPVEPEPKYDATAPFNQMVVVVDQHEVAKGKPLGGVHLTVKGESAKSDNDTLDVYLGPTDYLKDFQITFSKGDRVQVTGCKTKYSGNPAVLAREVRRDTTTVYLRDDRGTPYWRKS